MAIASWRTAGGGSQELKRRSVGILDYTRCRMSISDSVRVTGRKSSDMGAPTPRKWRNTKRGDPSAITRQGMRLDQTRNRGSNMNPVRKTRGHGSTGPQGMAEYQHGYSMLGHAPGPNPKSAAEHESSPQKQNGTHTCKASDLKKAGIPRKSPVE